MATLLNGGSVEVVNGHLVVTTLKKADEDGNAVSLTDELDEVVVPLSDVEEVGYTRGGPRFGAVGAVSVKHRKGSLLLKVNDEDALPLVAALRAPVEHKYDTEYSDSSDE